MSQSPRIKYFQPVSGAGRMRTNNKLLLLCMVVTLLMSCSGNDAIANSDLYGNYEIDKYVLKDSNAEETYKPKILTLTLMEKNNFILHGYKNDVTGYWSIQKGVDDNYLLSLQNSGIETRARLNGTVIYFEAPNYLLDSVFSYVLFVKLNR